MHSSICKVLIFGITAWLFAACSISPNKHNTGYQCAQRGTCNLPEKIIGEMGLVYVIRPFRFINSSERHYLHVEESVNRQKKYVGYLTAGTYCVLHTSSDYITLISSGGNNEDRINIKIEGGRKHYVHLSTQNTLTSFKLTTKLKQVEESEGEKYLMGEVYSKCQK